MIKSMASEDSNSATFLFSHHDERIDLSQLMRTTVENLNEHEKLNKNLVSVL
jgi:hypothetical protein